MSIQEPGQLTGMLTGTAQNFQALPIVQAITKGAQCPALQIFEIFDPCLPIHELGRKVVELVSEEISHTLGVRESRNDWMKSRSKLT